MREESLKETTERHKRKAIAWQRRSMLERDRTRGI